GDEPRGQDGNAMSLRPRRAFLRGGRARWRSGRQEPGQQRDGGEQEQERSGALKQTRTGQGNPLGTSRRTGRRRTPRTPPGVRRPKYGPTAYQETIANRVVSSKLVEKRTVVRFPNKSVAR